MYTMVCVKCGQEAGFEDGSIEETKEEGVCSNCSTDLVVTFPEKGV